jgi:hypothetical protein
MFNGITVHAHKFLSYSYNCFQILAYVHYNHRFNAKVRKRRTIRTLCLSVFPSVGSSPDTVQLMSMKFGSWCLRLTVVRWISFGPYNWRSRDSSVGIATGHALDGRGSILVRGKRFSLIHSIQTSSGAHPASYPMGTGVSFPAGKAGGPWGWPLTSIWCRNQEWWSYTTTPPYVFMA